MAPTLSGIALGSRLAEPSLYFLAAVCTGIGARRCYFAASLHWVDRTFGYPIARKYGGHDEGQRGDVGTTIVYVGATLEEVAAALSVLTGEVHPLADRQLLARHQTTERGAA